MTFGLFFSKVTSPATLQEIHQHAITSKEAFTTRREVTNSLFQETPAGIKPAGVFCFFSFSFIPLRN